MKPRKKIALVLAFGAMAAGLFPSFISLEDTPQVSSGIDKLVERHVGTSPIASSIEGVVNVGAVTIESEFECTVNYDAKYQDLQMVAARLADSDNPEHLLMAALFGTDRDSAERIDAIRRALIAAPDHPLIAWNFQAACSRLPEVPVCTDQNIEDLTIKVDSSNGQTWARIAGLRMKRGDLPGALEALKNATVAPEFNDYWLDHVELFERGLAAAGNPTYRARTAQAIGMAVAMASVDGQILDACRNEAVKSVNWLQQCLRYAERLEHSANTLLASSIGLSLQSSMYSISGDKEKQAATDSRQDKLRGIMRSGWFRDGQVVLIRDESVFAEYMAEWSTYGEVRALRFLQDEVQRLKQLPGYDPCTL